MGKRTVRLVQDAVVRRPALDVAVSKALLERVSAGAEPETLRLYRPGRAVVFGPQDTRALGYREAVAAARARGFAAVERLEGGRAAVFHEGTIAFAWTIPDPEPHARTLARFEEVAGLVAAALRRLGVDARVGEVAGAYCPGRYSVNARGQRKLMGVGQRLATRAAHVGGVVVVAGSQRLRGILVPVYDALRLGWDPASVGSIEDELGTVSSAQVQGALLDTIASRYDLADGPLGADTLALAETMEASFLSRAPAP